MRLPLATNARAKMGDLHDGFVKLFARRSTGVIMGGVVVAPGASELILPIALAVTKGLTVADLAQTFAIYPSLSGSITEAGRRLMGGRPPRLTGGEAATHGGAAATEPDVTSVPLDIRDPVPTGAGTADDGVDGFLPARPRPLARRRLLRSLAVAAAVVSGVVAPVALSGAVASADAAAGQPSRGSWCRPGRRRSPPTRRTTRRDEPRAGQLGPDRPRATPCPIESDAVDGVPSGPTVEVTVGSEHVRRRAAAGASTPTVTSTAPPSPRRPVTNEVTVAMVAPAGSASTGDGTPLATVVAAVDGRRGALLVGQTDGAVNLHVAADARLGAHRRPAAPSPVRCGTRSPRAVRFVPGPGKHLLLYVSRDSDCAYALAEVGRAPSSGGRLYVRDTAPRSSRTSSGTTSASATPRRTSATAPSTPAPAGTSAYRDDYDVMGYSWAEVGTSAPRTPRSWACCPPAGSWRWRPAPRPRR